MGKAPLARLRGAVGLLLFLSAVIAFAPPEAELGEVEAAGASVGAQGPILDKAIHMMKDEGVKNPPLGKVHATLYAWRSVRWAPHHGAESEWPGPQLLAQPAEPTAVHREPWGGIFWACWG